MSNKKPDPDTLQFFKLLHELLSSHHDRELVNKIHRLRNAKGVSEWYAQAAWEHMEVCAALTQARLDLERIQGGR